MKFPQSSKEITRYANKMGIYDFTLTKDLGCVCIHTVDNKKQNKQTIVIGHYYTHSFCRWLRFISDAINGNTTTPNIT